MSKRKKKNKVIQSGKQKKQDKQVKQPANAVVIQEAKSQPLKENKPAGDNAKAAEVQHILHPTISYIYILVLFVLLIAVFLLKLKADSDLKAANALNEQFKEAMITASENIAQLSAENTEQKKQLEALSLALNARNEIDESQKQAEEELSVPELYPVKGDATVVSAPENGAEAGPEEEELLRFSMYEGSYAVATGNGTIEALSDGDGLVNIIVDHGNGYKSNYTGEGIALKEIGDEIKQGDALMIFTGDGLDFTYSLSLDGKAVNPVSVMSIDG